MSAQGLYKFSSIIFINGFRRVGTTENNKLPEFAEFSDSRLMMEIWNVNDFLQKLKSTLGVKVVMI